MTIRKIGLVILVLSAVFFGSGTTTHAYPPDADVAETSPSTVGPGGRFTVTVACQPAENVAFEIVDSTDDVTCSAGPAQGLVRVATGSATGTLTAPTTPGTYTGSATGSQSDLIAFFTITVSGDVNGDDGTPVDGTTPDETAAPGAPDESEGTPTDEIDPDDAQSAPDPDAGAAQTPTGDLPSTGASGVSGVVLAAGGVVVVGLGLLAVAAFRRRTASVASSG